MLKVGWIFTALCLIGLIAVVVLNFDSAQILGLNGWGDFLSGGFAPLAFFWLVLGYFQQGKELKLSREALLLQASELKSSVLQQEQLVLATREDIDLSKEESKRRLLADRRRVEPLFVLREVKDFTYSDDEALPILNIVNNGGVIRQIVPRALTMPNHIRVELNYEINGWDTWAHGTVKEFAILVPSVDFSSLPLIEIEVGYIDSNGEKGSKLISAAVENGTVVSISSKDWLYEGGIT